MTSTQTELETIRLHNGGILRPIDVVEFARDPKSALHGRFQWDDTEAAAEYRIWQARQIIRVTVRVVSNSVTPIRAYVSLIDDRENEGGGYRALADVLSDKDLLAAMLAQALAELELFRAKYSMLEALKPLFDAVDEVTEKAKKRKPVAVRKSGSARRSMASTSV